MVRVCVRVYAWGNPYPDKLACCKVRENLQVWATITELLAMQLLRGVHVGCDCAEDSVEQRATSDSRRDAGEGDPAAAGCLQ